MPKLNTKALLHHLKRTFVAGKSIKGTDLLKKHPWLKHTLQDQQRKTFNKAQRQILRKSLGKNPLSALGSSKYRKTLGGQIKGYGKSLAEEIKHPIQTTKKQIGGILYSHDMKTPNSINFRRRSHFGKALQGGLLYGIPLTYGIGSLRDKDPDKPKSEKIIRSIPEFLAMATPKAIPSLAMYQVPGMIYAKKNKERKEKALAEALNLTNLPIVSSSHMSPIISAAGRRFPNA